MPPKSPADDTWQVDVSVLGASRTLMYQRKERLCTKEQNVCVLTRAGVEHSSMAHWNVAGKKRYIYVSQLRVCVWFLQDRSFLI